MNKEIGSRAYRQEKFKEMIKKLHEGVPVDSVKEEFKDMSEVVTKTKAGHPVHTFLLENTAIQKFINENLKVVLQAFLQEANQESRQKLAQTIPSLLMLNKHYARKEQLLFPYMEKYNITPLPQIMWMVDDDIRTEIKSLKTMFLDPDIGTEEIITAVSDLIRQVEEMIFTEENILFPLFLEILTKDDWMEIEQENQGMDFSVLST